MSRSHCLNRILVLRPNRIEPHLITKCVRNEIEKKKQKPKWPNYFEMLRWSEICNIVSFFESLATRCEAFDQAKFLCAFVSPRRLQQRNDIIILWNDNTWVRKKNRNSFEHNRTGRKMWESCKKVDTKTNRKLANERIPKHKSIRNWAIFLPFFYCFVCFASFTLHPMSAFLVRCPHNGRQNAQAVFMQYLVDRSHSNCVALMLYQHYCQ